ncbi:MAG TPA: AAA family ATPase, partial [Candidatus Caenarcaniphilales bacterium]
MISNLTAAGYPSRPELEEAFASQIFWASGGNGEPCILDNLPEIPEEIFSNNRVRLVVSVQIAVRRNGYYPDFWVVEQELERRGHLDFIEKSYLASLAERPFPIVMEQALNTLLMLHRQRKLIELGEQLSQSASTGKDPEELVRQTIEKLERLSSPKTNDPNEKLRCELRLLSREEDPIVKLRRRAEIAICYGIKATDIDQAIIALRQQESEADVPSYGIGEFFNLETDALTWLIAGLLPKKETIILSGAPKSGKSLLAIDIAFAVATGESAFLGESPVKGKVLLISVDESQQSTKAKLLKRGFRAQDKGQVRILPKWNISQRRRLEQELEDFRPDLVVVDCLRRISHSSIISENSAEFADQ